VGGCVIRRDGRGWRGRDATLRLMTDGGKAVGAEDDLESRAHDRLVQMFGADASFRDDQLGAILDLVRDGRKELLVKRTGWGKSLVYFIATRLIRDGGGGITLLVSPLLSLMRNQVQMANKMGLRAETINSSNQDDWDEIEARLSDDECDILLVTPEKLANEKFRDFILANLQGGIGLLVVDEAHCISDWGHDFRPAYRRISSVVKLLPPSVPLLATTATANTRVVADIEDQFGPDLATRRGPLARRSLRLQAVKLADQAERLAWLAEHIPDLPGSGIVYCLTVGSTRVVARWLESRGIESRAYYGGLDPAQRLELEEGLVENHFKVLVATVALGMGFDKPDLGFVIHFQRPGSVVAYYQQVGRAGRAVDEAFAVLLNGREDDDIQEFFIGQAFPPIETILEVLNVVEANNGISLDGIATSMNEVRGRIEQCLEYLDVEGVVVREGSQYLRSANPWEYDGAEAAAVTAERYRELARMQEFVETSDCLMEFVARELGDPDAQPCGRCATCAGPAVGENISEEVVRDAVLFLRRSNIPFEPRKQWPRPWVEGWRGNIPAAERTKEGRALSIWEDAGWGLTVKRNKYTDHRFGDDLVEATRDLIETRWQPSPSPEWLTFIPSRREPGLLLDFAKRLAERLGLECRVAILKIKDTDQQKLKRNSYQQFMNIRDAFGMDDDQVIRGPVLLLDDVLNSGWSLAIAGRLLRQHGSGIVYPYVLAKAHG
jgi:ATP-dependent DNA helicase RecQ